MSSFFPFYCLLLALLLPELQHMTSEVSRGSQHFQILWALTCNSALSLATMQSLKKFPKLHNCPWGPSSLLNLKLYYNIFCNLDVIIEIKRTWSVSCSSVLVFASSEKDVFKWTAVSKESQNSAHFNFSPLKDGISSFGSFTELPLEECLRLDCSICDCCCCCCICCCPIITCCICAVI